MVNPEVRWTRFGRMVVSFAAVLSLTIGCHKGEFASRAKGFDRTLSTSASSTNDLFEEIERGRVKAVRRVLESGLSPNVQDRLDWPALHAAIGKGDFRVVRLLLDFGADVNRVDGGGTPALVYAARCNNADIVEVLLRNGADVNAGDEAAATTPIMAVALGLGRDWQCKEWRQNMKQQLMSAKLLLHWGAAVNATNWHGYTALDLAEQTLTESRMNQPMVDLLTSHGAKRAEDLK